MIRRTERAVPEERRRAQFIDRDSLPGQGYRSCTADFSIDGRACLRIVVAFLYYEQVDLRNSRICL